MEHFAELSKNRNLNHVKNAIFGLTVGDALGVPVEFKSRKELEQSPVTDMFGYGTYDQPPGTWSDDSSLSLCLAEELVKGVDIKKIADSFVKWYYENYWTPHGEVFDIGISTKNAIKRLRNGEKAELAGGFEEESNGNGSLMRILPLVFETMKIKDASTRFALIKKVSSITHGHLRSCLACFYYLEFASFICSQKNNGLKDAYIFANDSFKSLTQGTEMNLNELAFFDRLLSKKIDFLPVKEIRSSGHVIDTLEASIWCLLTTDSYKKAVLKAINLGDDTDTTGAVTGGLAGLFYGAHTIPKTWVNQLARKNDILALINKLSIKYSMPTN